MYTTVQKCGYKSEEYVKLFNTMNSLYLWYIYIDLSSQYKTICSVNFFSYLDYNSFPLYTSKFCIRQVSCVDYG